MQITLPGIALRPETPADESFLLALFGTTRAGELAMTGWDARTREAFIQHQFKAMRQGYASMFPTGEFSIITQNEQPIGRMVIHRSDRECHVVDMALLPAHQNRQIGTHLMQSLQTEAAAAGQRVRLHVLKMNRAQRFYQRLNFVKINDNGIYDLLEWVPNNPIKPATA
jgi:ribosomal protein S18 acetylase RimI-like enzyme